MPHHARRDRWPFNTEIGNKKADNRIICIRSCFLHELKDFIKALLYPIISSKVVEECASFFEHGFSSRLALPPSDNRIAVMRAQLTAEAFSARSLCGDDRCSASQERIIDILAWRRIVFDRSEHALNRFLRAVSPCAFPRIPNERNVPNRPRYSRIAFILSRFPHWTKDWWVLCGGNQRRALTQRW